MLMKKIITLFLAVVFAGFTAQAGTSAYRPDHAGIDQLFAQAESVSIMDAGSMAPYADSHMGTGMSVLKEKDPGVAFALSFVLGYLGIHRAYLGTSTGTIVAYILTAGGCGIVATVDWIVLLIGLINDDISKYVDNPSFFMW